MKANTTNTTYFNLQRDGAEMAESPIIPGLLAQNYSRQKRSAPSESQVTRPTKADPWKLGAIDKANATFIPAPLFSSEKCVVETRTEAEDRLPPATISNTEIPSIGIATATASPTTTTTATTTASATPITPSPSLFPVPPSNKGIIASPVSMALPGSVYASSSALPRSPAHSQDNSSKTAAAGPGPRPSSSVYSQNSSSSVNTMVATSTPRTPTLTSWESTLPGLPAPGASFARTSTQTGAHSDVQPSFHNEQDTWEQQKPQQIQVQIQVPRLRSPSLPQDRASRRRTISSTSSANNRNGRGKRSVNSLPPAVQELRPMSVPETGAHTAVTDYEGGDWPLRSPLVTQNMESARVRKSKDTDTAARETFPNHFAQTEFIPSPIKPNPGPEHVHSGYHADAHTTSPRPSLADSQTPINGPGEQRSGSWFSDDEDAEQARGVAGYAAVETAREKTEAQRRRTRKIKIIAGASILAVLVVVGVAVGVALAVARG
ncbi:hypothetical protein F5Y19DRAFT_393849 [Xylariaceae sp. FL1651]|nr:hypothetical protein F5Y19DRAFT_393849 [Xylariaceae sp. FL1651]